MNTKQIKLPYFSSDKTIRAYNLDDKYIVFDTDLFNIQFDGIQLLKFRQCDQNVCGLCGNNNQNKNDDSNVNSFLVKDVLCTD